MAIQYEFYIDTERTQIVINILQSIFKICDGYKNKSIKVKIGGYSYGMRRVCVIGIWNENLYNLFDFKIVYKHCANFIYDIEKTEEILNYIICEISKISTCCFICRIEICRDCGSIVEYGSLCNCKKLEIEEEEREKYLNSNNGLVYFIRALDRVKIGFVYGSDPKNINKRIKTLRTGMPVADDEIEVIKYVDGSLRKEKEYHKMFSEYRLTQKNEWFILKGDLKKFLIGEEHE